MINKKRKLGKKIQELKVGDHHSITRKIEDRDLLMYLGLSDDANPLYLQHDYASQTPYKRPLVPAVMLVGMVSSLVSMQLPGPGSHILRQELNFPEPLYHYSEVSIRAEVTKIDAANHEATINIVAKDNDEKEIITGIIVVSPPYEPESMTAQSLENFY
ncbi:MaoC/PaaZ C-terminal domain-containing protein [Thalassobacillus pellis]|uniref:MaoC/PaaZ C-terminal domain-containing protein n=1 Tax=Thalassobacillus pellis TaxID=748008 RepID=UPI0019619822|nr:MaoC/PaaZ C-terminal domain-containing protein [Thalassobacillus pellis]MBM7554990.1 acyl dehydratase [Thalassobacillus pellis]